MKQVTGAQAKNKIFTWYARHPKFGDLILLIPPQNVYRTAFIYSPRIVRDRLGAPVSFAAALELNFGPMGLIPRRFYAEAGIAVNVPWRIRMIALMDSHFTRNFPDVEKTPASEHDNEISAFILDEWQRVYNSY